MCASRPPHAMRRARTRAFHAFIHAKGRKEEGLLIRAGGSDARCHLPGALKFLNCRSHTRDSWPSARVAFTTAATSGAIKPKSLFPPAPRWPAVAHAHHPRCLCALTARASCHTPATTSRTHTGACAQAGRAKHGAALYGRVRCSTVRAGDAMGASCCRGVSAEEARMRRTDAEITRKVRCRCLCTVGLLALLGWRVDAAQAALWLAVGRWLGAVGRGGGVGGWPGDEGRVDE